MTISADMSTADRASAVLATKRRANIPHPDDPSMRVVGWVIPEELAGLSAALFALDEIVKRATLSLHDGYPGSGALIDQIVREVAELPDRTSPEDQPEMMLVSGDELRVILALALSPSRDKSGECVARSSQHIAEEGEKP